MSADGRSLARFGARFSKMIFTTFDIPRRMRAVAFGVSIGLALDALGYLALFMWYFNLDLSVKYSCNIKNVCISCIGFEVNENIGSGFLV